MTLNYEAKINKLKIKADIVATEISLLQEKRIYILQKFRTNWDIDQLNESQTKIESYKKGLVRLYKLKKIF